VGRAKSRSQSPGHSLAVRDSRLAVANIGPTQKNRMKEATTLGSNAKSSGLSLAS